MIEFLVFIVLSGIISWRTIHVNLPKSKQAEALLQELRDYYQRASLSEFSRDYHYDGLLDKSDALPALRSVLHQWESVDHSSSQVDPHAMAETIVERELLELDIPVDRYSRNFVLGGLFGTFIGLAYSFFTVSSGGFSPTTFFPGVGSAMGSTICFLAAAQYLNWRFRNHEGVLDRAKALLVQLLVSDSYKIVSSDDAESSLNRLIALYQDVSVASKQAAEQVGHMSIATTSIMEGFQESIQRFLEATNTTSEIARRVGEQQQAQFDREVELGRVFTDFRNQVGQLGQHLTEQNNLTREQLYASQKDREVLSAGLQSSIEQGLEFKRSLDTYSQHVNQAEAHSAEIAAQQTSAVTMLMQSIESLNREVASVGASSGRLKDLIEQKIDSIESKELFSQMSHELQQQAQLIHSLHGVGSNLSAVAQKMEQQQQTHNQSLPGVVAAMQDVQRSIAQTGVSLQQALKAANAQRRQTFLARVLGRK